MAFVVTEVIQFLPVNIIRSVVTSRNRSSGPNDSFEVDACAGMRGRRDAVANTSPGPEPTSVSQDLLAPQAVK